MRKNHGISAKPHVIKRLSIGRDEWYTKRKGEIAELIFVIKASSMGFAVSKPYGDSEAYDLVIEETRSGAPDPEQAAALLAERALEAGIARVADQGEIDGIWPECKFAFAHGAPCSGLL